MEMYRVVRCTRLTLHFFTHREFMSSFLVFDHKPHYCSMSKIIPADRLMTFSIWHCKLLPRATYLYTSICSVCFSLQHSSSADYVLTFVAVCPVADYQQHHVSWSSLFAVDENIRGGYHPYGTNAKDPQYVPPCWERLVAQSRQEQVQDSLPPSQSPTESPTTG